MSQQPPPPPQAPPAGYYPPQPPPKKSHTIRNVFIGVILAFLVLIGGCMALLGSAANEVSKAVEEGTEEGLSDEEANDTPTVVIAGKGFTHDQFKVAPGWKVGKEEFTESPQITNIRVTNVSDEGQRTALLTFRFYKGKDVLAEVSCSTNEMQAGERSAMECFSTSEFPAGYKQIKVADAF